MLISEHINDDGQLVRTNLSIGAKGAVLTTDDEPAVTLPVRAILVAMRRFGRPLEAGVEPAGDVLDLGSGIELRELRFRAGVDVEPRSYVVLCGDGEPLAALATQLAGALRFIGKQKR